MDATRLFNRSIVVGCAAAVLILPTPAGVRAEPATSQYVAADLLSAERQDARSLFTAFDRFFKRADALDKKTSVTKSELDAVVADAEAVKRAIPTFQRAISSMISKLKTAGKWTPELDTFVENQLKTKGVSDARLREFRENGGARRALEIAGAKSAELTAALDGDIKALRAKSGFVQRLLGELLGKPVYASLFSRLHACWLVHVYMDSCAMGDATDCIIMHMACEICVGRSCS